MSFDGSFRRRVVPSKMLAVNARTKRLVAGLFFYPRGGSAQVVRSLGRVLPAAGWEVALVAGSLGEAGDRRHAPTFFRGLDVCSVDYSPATRLGEPLVAGVAFQLSYEDRRASPDRVFARVDDAAYERLVSVWIEALGAGGAESADVLHLHHLTPLNEAAVRAFPHVPVVGQLHGTELAMLRVIEAGAPSSWTYAQQWAERMRRWARSCARLILSSEAGARDALALLDVEPWRISIVPNGIDPNLFDRSPLSGEARLAHWHRSLVEEPRGWDETGVPGTVTYREEDFDAFREGGAVLVYSGRYTEVKRIPLLIAAYVRASERFPRRSPLVLVGGYPGEYEGPHPLEAVRAASARGVFLAGWHEHHEVAEALNAADLLVLPSIAEAFGLVLIEAMACGLPVIACAAYGPSVIVDEGETGWLVPPDDEAALAQALVEAVANPGERRRRGALAYSHARNRYAWSGIALRLAGLYHEIATLPDPCVRGDPTGFAREPKRGPS
jgi:glycosyltransferase involved in cell wall biosynthesis